MLFQINIIKIKQSLWSIINHMLMSYKPKYKVRVITDMNNILIPSIWRRSISFTHYSIRNQNKSCGGYSKCIKGKEDPRSQYLKRQDFELGPPVTTYEVPPRPGYGCLYRSLTHKSSIQMVFSGWQSSLVFSVSAPL